MAFTSEPVHDTIKVWPEIVTDNRGSALTCPHIDYNEGIDCKLVRGSKNDCPCCYAIRRDGLCPIAEEYTFRKIDEQNETYERKPDDTYLIRPKTAEEKAPKYSPNWTARMVVL